jgi:hypothetical protein
MEANMKDLFGRINLQAMAFIHGLLLIHTQDIGMQER